MAHIPKLWFRAARGQWYVQINGKQVPLGPNKDEAFKCYHAIMATPQSTPTPPPPSDAVAVLCDLFIDSLIHHRAEDIVRWYKDRLQAFLDYIPKGLTVAQLKPFHVQRWIDGMENVKSGTKRNYVRAVKRALGRGTGLHRAFTPGPHEEARRWTAG